MGRIELLIERMTLSEKLGQLTMSASSEVLTGPTAGRELTAEVRSGAVGSVLNLYGRERLQDLQRVALEESRLGIPLLAGLDIIHGYRTLFPVGLAEAAQFDAALWERSAREAAIEAAHEGINLTFAPMLDVSRDPRWGRTCEGPGEDPLLASQVARAKVRGFQGRQLRDPTSLAAVAKHYCAYGPVTAGREYASVDISERTLHEVHLPPFEAAVAAGVAAVMPAFTDLAGVPMSTHEPLLRGWLRDRLGFQGVLISDYNAIGELLAHGVAADLAQAATLALGAGIDVDMMAGAYREGLPVALERGWVSVAQIDEAVRRVLVLKEQLGLFEAPLLRGGQAEPAGAVARRRAAAREGAARSLVLLSNRGEVLPLAGSLERLAVVGPLADAPAEMRGPWWAAAEPDGAVSVLAGLRAALPAATIGYAAGASIQGSDTDGFGAALAVCDRAQAIVLCLGEAAVMSGEAASRAHLDLPGRQRELAEAICERARETGTPVVALLFCGRPLVIPWLSERADALLVAWFPGSEAGHAIADVLTGRRSPSARTPMSWPRALGQVPLFYAQRPTGRPADPANHYSSRYLDVANEPLFSFGHGLTYGRFVHSNLRVSARELRAGETLQVQIDVTNEGSRAAQETVLLFARDVLASVARPLLELKGWGRIELAPGERGTVTIPLAAEALRFLGARLEPVFEAGEVELLAGPCAERSRLLSTRIELVAAA